MAVRGWVDGRFLRIALRCCGLTAVCAGVAAFRSFAFAAAGAAGHGGRVGGEDRALQRCTPSAPATYTALKGRRRLLARESAFVSSLYLSLFSMSSLSDLAATLQLAAFTLLGSAVLCFGLAVLYVVFVRREVCRWFGELERRDREPRRRRQRFEACAVFAVGCVAAVAPLRVFLAGFAPSFFPVVLALLLGGALLSGWSAFAKLRDPDNA